MASFVCYGGKGGVGKTTLAASTAVAAANRGAKTLVISTDPAHSLADAFEVEPDSRQVAVDNNLWIEELSPDAGRAAYRAIVDSLASELRSAGIQLDDETVERLFTAGVVPGSDELAAIEALASHTTDSEFDQIVVDTAPTGHTLRLLDLPSVLRETVAAADSLRGQLRRTVDTARSAVFGPAYLFGRRRETNDEFEAMANRMEQVRALLTDPNRVDFRVVCLPESMAVAETERLVDQLTEFGVPAETVVVNRVLTDPEPDCQRCQATERAHREQIDRLEAAVPDRRLVSLPAVRPDLTARETVDRLAGRLPEALIPVPTNDTQRGQQE
jgi:arsenite-transporting ATPase